MIELLYFYIIISYLMMIPISSEFDREFNPIVGFIVWLFSPILLPIIIGRTLIDNK